METSDSQLPLQMRDEPHAGDERREGDYDPSPADPPDAPPLPWPDDTEVDIPE